FFAKYISNSGLLEIGTVNSPDEPETFTLIASFSLTTNYKYYQLLFDDYTGSHKYIALRSQGVRAFVDDLGIDLIPACVQPTSLRASNIASNEAGLMWDAGNDESKWELAYGNPGFDPDTEGTKIQNINQTSVTITGLIPGTRLEAYVRSDCGTGENSEWSLPFAFITACGALELPFAESFTDPLEPLCWVDENDFWNLASETNFANGTSPYEAHFYGRSYSGTTRLIIPALNTVGVQELKLTFKSRKRFFNYIDDAFIFVATRLNNTWWLSSTWQMDVKSGSNDEMLIEVPIVSSLGGSTEIAFCIWGSHSVLTEWAIDDIQVTETTSCFTPINLDVFNISSNSAEISWQQPGTESLWDIEYGPEGFTLGEGTLIEGVTANPFEINGLEMAATYEVYVRASCGEGQHSYWSEPILFNTICDLIYDLPFSETFESSFMPICWEEQVDDHTQIDDFESWIVEEYDDAGGSPNQLALYYCDYNGISRLVLPRLNTSGIEGVQLAFTTYINDDGNQLPLDFKLQKSYDGVLWTDIPGWSYNTESGEYGPQQVEVDVNGIASNVLYLAFVVDGDHDNFYYWSIDNVEVTSNSSLPENLAVINSLEASNDQCFNASNQITVAGNGETVIIPATVSATFIAGQSIRFLPGFHAQVGSYVDAHITTSGEYCSFAPAAPIVQAETVDEKSIVLDDFANSDYELFAEKQVLLYPNPNNGRFTIQLQNFDKKVQLMVVNLLGKVVFQANVSDSDYFEINMLNVQRGVYSVVVTDNKTVQTRKIVVY
ncbi:MAG TPA: T9SS type A sorting domain-containing protein, partial [Prolixibacteraceae bacterium]|nr:T9SS type A sorting domain-containing protein [Prolixibacteraceae bacterium]